MDNNTQYDSSPVSSSMPETPDEPYSPNLGDYRQTQQLHQLPNRQFPPPDYPCSRSSAAYTPASLESTEIICTSSTSHAYNDGALLRPGEFSTNKNTFFPATPCNCNSCQISRPTRDSAGDVNAEFRPYLINDGLYKDGPGNFPSAQCGCETCVDGMDYDGAGETSSMSAIVQPLPFPPTQTTVPAAVASTLPRSDSQIPDYFEGDPSIMINSKSDHSIKIQMTGDTMQVEITSPVVDVGGDDSDRIDDGVGNLSADFEALFREMEGANGELTRIPEACVRNWGAEIVVALDELHRLGIEWKDFNPRNILMDEKGHVLLTYISRLPCQESFIDDCARCALYAAPEADDADGMGRVPFACDWWSVGAVLYEMLTGESLHQRFPQGFYPHTQLVEFPDHLSTEARSLLKDLLKYHPHCRLGAGHGGFEEIKSHPFFEGIQWPIQR